MDDGIDNDCDGLIDPPYFDETGLYIWEANCNYYTCAFTKEDETISNLVAQINARFQQCETTREDDEDRWLQAFHNYRGRYFKNVAFRDHEKSRVFVKVTKTKVLAAYGQQISNLVNIVGLLRIGPYGMTNSGR